MGKPRKAIKRTVALLLEQQADKIIAAYQEGKELEQLSEQFIAGIGVIKRLLISHDITLRHKPRNRPRRNQLTEHEPVIVEAYRNGASVASLARQYQVSPRIIQQILNEYKVQRIGQSIEQPEPTAEEQKIIAAYQARRPIIAISYEFSISSAKLYKILDCHQIPRRYVHGIP